MQRSIYIAYGSNLNKKQMKDRCPDSKKIGATILEGYKLNFRGTRRGFGVANIERCKGSIVPVGIWSISRYDELELDIYEGYPNLYMKDFLPFNYGGKRYEGMVYIMRPGHPVMKPAKHYENTIRAGYMDFGISSEYLDNALVNCENQEKDADFWRKYYDLIDVEA